jgi:hypothetical protein
MATSSFNKKFVAKVTDISLIEKKIETKNKGKKINRNITSLSDMVRGKSKI